jgi:two-component system sensor histidine kinase VanS
MRVLIVEDGRRDEFRELADAIDGMLAQLEAHVAEQQRFAANASHELRTPLAITRTLLEVARKQPDRDPRALLDRLLAVNSRAIDLTEALLLSRADQRSSPREVVDLSLLAEEAAETLLPLAEEHGVDVQVSGGVTPAVGSPTPLLQLTTNLLHHAIVHNAAGGGTVRVTTAVSGGTAVLAVENTGDELAPELVTTLTEPFRRGTERVHGRAAGRRNARGGAPARRGPGRRPASRLTVWRRSSRVHKRSTSAKVAPALLSPPCLPSPTNSSTHSSSS